MGYQTLEALNKIQKYFKLSRKIDSLDKESSKLKALQDNIFLSKFKNNSIFCDAKSTFDVFLKHPNQAFDRYDLENYVSFCWSKESLNHNMRRIIKVLYDENFIIREEKGYYGLNPIFVNTVKRNIKKEE